jgi:uncharacterized protein (TIRG00374 family)
MTMPEQERSDPGRKHHVHHREDTRRPRSSNANTADQTSASTRPTAKRWGRLIARLVLWLLIVSVLVIPQLPRLREATVELQTINLTRTAIGFVLVMASIACYSGLTRTAMGDPARQIPHLLMYRIQLSTRALANVVPGGNATASAFGFRLLTQTGASNARAGVALATAGLCSAAVLNALFWVALAISLPTRGSDSAFILAAVFGLVLLAIIATVGYMVVRGSDRLLRLTRRVAQRLSIDPNRYTAALKETRQRVTDLRNDRPLLLRLIAWSTAQWTLDMAALWVFLSAFEIRLDPLTLILVFGAANIAAAVPITPGGLGIVEGVYITSLVRIGYTFQAATLGIATYRVAHYVFPIIVGGGSYLTLRTGPWRLTTDQQQQAAEPRSLVDQRGGPPESRSPIQTSSTRHSGQQRNQVTSIG